MINAVLKAAGVPGKPARFSDPPPLYAVWFDSIETDGADQGEPHTVEHDCTVELYADTVSAGGKALKALGRELIVRGIQYSTQGWYYLSAVRKYQEVIEFSYIEKT